MKYESIKKELDQFVSENEEYKNIYFWTPPGSASGRRAKEFSRTKSWVIGNKKVKMCHILSCSCKNMYFTKGYFIDNQKVTISRIKKEIIPLLDYLIEKENEWSNYLMQRGF